MADKDESRNLVLFVGNLPLRYLPMLHVTTSQQTSEYRTCASFLKVPIFFPQFCSRRVMVPLRSYRLVVVSHE